MPNRILGLNISFAYVDDYESLVQFVNELRPAYCVMIVDGKTPAQINDQIAKAKALTARMPYTIWIYRVHNDDDGRWWFPASDGRPQIATAQDYINEYGHLGQNGGI
ncbi:hypothetical protein KDA23_03165, partial [Candidatus Saccharibacteria bacterium]|nr:hypothetical protein [Candidatus Saccharibacteria bacterium]